MKLNTLFIFLFLSILLVPVLLSAAPASGSETGFLSPSAQVPDSTGDGNGFEVNPAYALADDGRFAIDLDSGLGGSTACGDASRDGHIFSGFNPAIPAGAIIQGMAVRLDAKVDKVVNDPRLCVFLSLDGGLHWTAARSAPLTRSESSLLLGGPADLWGRSWSPVELSDAYFRLKVTTLAGAAYRDFSLDWATLKITYAAVGEPTPTQTPGPTLTPTPQPPSGSYKTVGYFAQWGIYKRNYLVKNLVNSGSASMITHLNYAFADVTSSARCASLDAYADYNKAFSASESIDGLADPTTAGVLRGNFNQLRKLKQLYPNLKILISVGGWSSSDYFSDAALPVNQQAFVASCIDMYLKGNFSSDLAGYSGIFDGIDLDWEYPGACGETCKFRLEDTQNFTALMAEFRRQLDALSAQTAKQYLLTIAAPAGPSYYDKIQLEDIHPFLDFINLMAYDYHGAWDTITNLHAPLYRANADPSAAQGLYADYAVQDYLARKVPAAKLVLGVPFYAHGWTGVPAGSSGDGLYQPAGTCARGKYECGTNDYKEMVPLEASYTKYFHSQARSVWIYNGRTLWTYDDPASLAYKMGYVKTLGLGGSMFWEFSGDTANADLLRAIYNNLR
jgi:chitinase